MIKPFRAGLIALALTFCSAPVLGHGGGVVPEPLNLPTLLGAFAWDMDSAEIKTESVDDNLHVLFGLGGNIGVSIGEDGVFIVDDQFPELMPKIRDAIKALGGGDVDFAVNTHWHFDHAEGNLTLGPDGTWIVAHENSREMMQGDHLINLVVASYKQEAYPESALPDVTYTDDMSFHINGQRIDLYHFGPAHTTGDTAIVFRGSKAVHLGDVFNQSGYPFIDAGNGGELAGMIHFCKETLKAIDEDYTVIPGHGPISKYEDLAEYIVMLETVHSRLADLIANGASLNDVYAAKPTAEFDKKFGDATGFINRSYMSMTHRPLAVDK